MNLSDLQRTFNRALQYTFCMKKLAMATGIMALCGVLVVFCHALSIEAGDWIVMSLTFLPVFLCGGVMLALGIVLIRIYHDEVKKRALSYTKILSKSWDIAIGASYFAVPIILCYLLMWMVLGVFFLLREIPGLGDFFGVVLAFGPFLINLGSLVLCALCLGVLFFVAPAVALKTTDPLGISQVITKRITGDVFTNLLYLFIATLPLIFAVGMLATAAFITGTTFIDADNALHQGLQWFFIMIPFTALMSPAVTFFFNLAAEAHVYLKEAA